MSLPRRAGIPALLVLLALALLLASCGSPGNPTPSGSPTGSPTGGQPTDPASPTDGTPSATPTDLPPTATPTPIELPGSYPTPDPGQDLHDVNDYFGPLPVVASPVPPKRNEARALYIGACGNLAKNVEIVENSPLLNALVVDIKESNAVYIPTKNELALEIGAYKGAAYDVENLVRICREKGITLIGRIVVFKDPILAEARPDLCIRDKAGNSLYFTNEGKKPFVNPYRQEVWDYNIALAIEAIEMGFDEIQFDYVRFPTGGTTTGEKPYFGETDWVPARYEVINRFLQKSRVLLTDQFGVPLGADVFAIIVSSKSDGERIGQDWATVGLTGIDNVAPMIYPSHYANSSTTHYSGNGKGTMLNGVHFTHPDLEPYKVLYNCLVLAQPAASQEGYAAVRTYLQAFTASYLPKGYYMEYGPAEIKAQIKAIQDAGFKEWICWNPRASYDASAFDGK